MRADRREYWQRQVAAWRSSGRSAAAWSAAQGLSVHSLRHWAWRLRQEASAAWPSTPTLLPIRVSPSSEDTRTNAAGAAVRIVLVSGTAIEVPSVAQVACAVSLAQALSC